MKSLDVAWERKTREETSERVGEKKPYTKKLQNKDGLQQFVVFTTHFSGENYYLWIVRMRTYLRAQSLLNIVKNGSTGQKAQ